MPYSIETDAPDCSGYAVVKDEDGEVMGCHATRGEAEDQLAALRISESKQMQKAAASDLSEGDYVMWESSGGTAYGRVDAIAMEGSLESSLRDEPMDASEDEPAIRIELVDKNDDGEIVGRGETVLHRAGTLSMAGASDIKSSTSGGRLHKSSALIFGGGALKDLSDKGDFGGYLVRFGSPDAHDLEGDFFTKDTDFWLHGATGSTKVGSEGSSFVLYGHGTDPELGTRRLAKGRLIVKDAGVWMETQMQRRNEYEEAIEQLAKQGALGLSSGTAAHLVETERKSGANWIKTWPLGLDASLTPEPAEPRTKIQPLKTSSIQPVRALAKSLQSGSDPLGELAEALGAVDDRLTKHQRDTDLLSTLTTIDQRL